VSEATPERPPRRAVSTLLVFALGMLLGRLTGQLPEGVQPLGDLAIAVLVAISVTVMWRRWARRTIERRRQEQLGRRARTKRP